MFLRMYSLSLEPEQPLRFSDDELRAFLNKKLPEYSALHGNDAWRFIHRYPVLQCKVIKGDLIVTGISQGAGCLFQLTYDRTVLGTGDVICRITARDQEIRSVPFGIADAIITYEFLTPWLALNQQHAKKFYELNGRQQRDAFMQKILTAQLNSLMKSLDCDIPSPVICEARVRFRKERIGRENVMVFRGKFRANVHIPDYLGIGRLVSRGYGTIKRITTTENSEYYCGDHNERRPACH